MLELKISNHRRAPDLILTTIYMIYTAMVVTSIVMFDELITFKFLGFDIILSGSIVPYVMLYPLSFIVLRIYGSSAVNNMIGGMILGSLSFVLLSKVIVFFASNTTEIDHIINTSMKMYVAGFLGMPAGIYGSFLCLSYLFRLGMGFNFISLSIASVFGEIINTYIVFPFGFHGRLSFHTIFTNVILDAMLFKIIAGIILSIVAMIVIRLIKIAYDHDWS